MAGAGGGLGLGLGGSSLETDLNLVFCEWNLAGSTAAMTSNFYLFLS